MAFILIGAACLVLALVFPLVVKEPPAQQHADAPSMPLRAVIRALFASRAGNCTYIGSGLSMFMQGSLIAWSPSYLNRYHGMDPARAALCTGVLVLLAGIGMVGGGYLVDRFSRHDRTRRLRIPALYALASALLLAVAFFLPPGGGLQLACLALGLLVGAGFAGPSGAVLADATPASIHATVFATLVLANNVLGLAPGPFLTGALADGLGLDVAMRFVPLAGLGAAGAYWVGGAGL